VRVSAIPGLVSDSILALACNMTRHAPAFASFRLPRAVPPLIRRSTTDRLGLVYEIKHDDFR
jgi:hypothetical protein